MKVFLEAAETERACRKRQTIVYSTVLVPRKNSGVNFSCIGLLEYNMINGPNAGTRQTDTNTQTLHG